MKIILPGYEGTKKVLSSVSFLLNKYMPDFNVFFLNYGEFNGKLYCGQYVNLDTEQVGGARSWMKYVIKYLESIDDDLIIFADGDFFITEPYNQIEYVKLLKDMEKCLVGFMSSGANNKRFSRLASYAIWNREFLLEVLKNKKWGGISTIWKFESRGARYVNLINKKRNIIAWREVVSYNPYSSIAHRRGPGKVAVGETPREDVEFLISAGHLNRDELVIEYTRANRPIINYK
jgi:hypothetical protein